MSTTEETVGLLTKKTEVRVVYVIAMPSGEHININGIRESDGKWFEEVFRQYDRQKEL